MQKESNSKDVKYHNPNIHPSGWYQDNNEGGVNPTVRTEDEDDDEIGTAGTSEEEETE